MTSWRETASPQAQADLDELLNTALGFAQQLLEKHGELYPFAVVIEAGGQQRMVAADSSSDGPPESATLITLLIATILEQRAVLRGAAIVADVRIPEGGGDAIRVALEHSDQVALAVLLPYRTRRLGRAIDYGDLQAGQGAGFIWPVQPNASSAR